MVDFGGDVAICLGWQGWRRVCFGPGDNRTRIGKSIKEPRNDENGGPRNDVLRPRDNRSRFG